jgi:hypothetical protein
MRAAVLAGTALWLAQAASAGAAECLFQMGGADVLVGPCEATEKDPTGSVGITSPDEKIVARIDSKGGGVGQAFWNGGVAGAAAETLIGPVILIGACWASDKAKLCVTR